MTDQKTAIITAAGRGMGAAIARVFAASDYRLALMSNTGGAESLAADLGGLGMTGSVTQASDPDRHDGRVGSPTRPRGRCWRSPTQTGTWVLTW